MFSYNFIIPFVEIYQNLTFLHTEVTDGINIKFFWDNSLILMLNNPKNPERSQLYPLQGRVIGCVAN